MMEPHGQSVKVEVKEEPADMEVSASHLPSPTASDSEDPLSLCDMMGVKDHSEDASSLCDAAAIKEDVSIKDEPVEDADLLNGTTTFVPNLKSGSGGNRSKNDYTRFKKDRSKTGGGPPPAPVEELTSKILPLIEDELNPHLHEWDSDKGSHSQAVVVNVDDGLSIISVSQKDTPDSPHTPQPEATPQQDGGPSSTPATGHGKKSFQRQRCARRNLGCTAKQEALQLASDRNMLQREMDLELHQRRMRLIEVEEEKTLEYYNMKMKLMSEYYNKKIKLLHKQLEMNEQEETRRR